MAFFSGSQRPSRRVLARSVLIAALLVFGHTLTASPRPDVLRTVYFSAVDAKGAHVTDLTAGVSARAQDLEAKVSTFFNRVRAA